MLHGEERTNAKNNGALLTEVRFKKKTTYEKIKTGNECRHPQDIGSERTIEADSHNVQSQS